VDDEPVDVALAGHTGDVDTARAGLQAAEPGTRAVALGALARLGALGPDDLRAALGDPEGSVRRRAAEEVGRDRQGAADGVELLALLADPDPTVVEAAAWASGERARPESGAVEALVALAGGHDDPLCREAAVAALGVLGDPAGLPAILAATTDRPAVRRRAVIALAPFDGPEVTAALQRALHDRDRQVRQAAEDLLL
jgi:HEAT repeat protein